MSKPHATCSICVLLAVMVGSAAPAQKLLVPSDPSQILSVIRAKNPLKDKPVASARIMGRIVVISTYKSADSSPEQEFKVDAILLARAVMEAYGGIQSVRVYFYDPREIETYKLVDVQKSLLSAFVAGTVNDEQMMGSLSVVGGSRLSQNNSTTQASSLIRPLSVFNPYDNSAISRARKELIGKDPASCVKTIYERLSYRQNLTTILPYFSSTKQREVLNSVQTTTFDGDPAEKANTPESVAESIVRHFEKRRVVEVKDDLSARERAISETSRNSPAPWRRGIAHLSINYTDPKRPQLNLEERVELCLEDGIWRLFRY